MRSNPCIIGVKIPYIRMSTGGYMQEAYVKLEQVTKVYHVGEVDIHAVDGIDF